MTIQKFASFEAETAQTSGTSKLVKAWEAKNAKRAVKASGVSLMAISLSACNGTGSVDTRPDGETQLNEDAGGPNGLAGAIGTATTPVLLTSNRDFGEFSGQAYAGEVWSPGGNARVDSLGDEDSITGTGDNDTLEATISADEVSPELVGVENLVIDFVGQGSQQELDLHESSGVKTITVDRISNDAGFDFSDISDVLTSITVNDGDDNHEMTFQFEEDVLSGASDVLALNLNRVAAEYFEVYATGSDGYETINITLDGNASIDYLEIEDTATVNVSGTGDLTIGDLVDSAGALATFDASAATGDMDIDLGASNVVEARVAGSSGTDIDFTYTGSEGNDYIRVDHDSLSEAPTGGDDADGHDTIDGGAGSNTLDFTVGFESSSDYYNLVDDEVTITNMQTVRIDVMGEDIATLDASLVDGLETVIVRNDSEYYSTSAHFDIMDMASDVLVQVQHASSDDSSEEVNGTIVHLHQADGTGSDDSQTVEIISGTNTAEEFNFTLEIEANDADSMDLYDEEVENVTIIDSDTENNTVLLDSAEEHDGTLTLTGGRANDTFTIHDDDQIIAETVDASGQLSDVTIDLGEADQTVTMGSGDDNVVFVDGGLDDDDHLDGGLGDDIITANFLASSNDDLNITGFETLRTSAAGEDSGDDLTIDVSESDDIATIELMGNNHSDSIAGEDAYDVTIEVIADGISAINLVDDNEGNNTFNSLVITDEDSGNPADMTITVDDAGAMTAGQITLDADTKNLTINNLGDDTDEVSFANGILAAGVTSLVVTDGNDTAQDTTTNVINLDDTLGLVSVDLSGALGGTDLTVEALADAATINMVQSDDVEEDAADALTITYVGDTGADDVEITGGGNDESVTITNGNMDDLVINMGGGDDTVNLYGMDGENVEVDGGAGNDSITAGDDGGEYFGGTGADTITGGIGDDTMVGGAGADTFVFVGAEIGNDTVDFTAGDKLDFQEMYGATLTTYDSFDAGSIVIEELAPDNTSEDAIDELITNEVFTASNTSGGAGIGIFVTYGADASVGTVYQVDFDNARQTFIDTDGVGEDLDDGFWDDDAVVFVNEIGTIDLGSTEWADLLQSDFVSIV